MANKLDNCEYWLPSQFLNDDDLLMTDFNSIGPDFQQHGFNFNPFGPHSDLSSPVESFIGSVDSETDNEEEYITELTRKMAHSTLHDSVFPLCGCNQSSTFGSFNPYQQLQLAHFQKLKQQQIMEQGHGVFGKGGFGQYLVNQSNQKLAQSRGQSGAVAVARPMNSSISGWPTLQQSQQQQQQPGSGMRAVFLGNNRGVPKKECAGTGVFLPRRIGKQIESRKKPGCSTVILPDRVVQALNLNLEALDAPSERQVQGRCYKGRGTLTPARGSTYQINMAAAQQRRNVSTENTYSQPMPQELLLPHEWTY